MKNLFISILLLITTLTVGSKEKESIKVAFAANLIYAMEEIKTEFSKKHPDIKLDLITASSGKLTAQILNGAPYDIFLSANMSYPKKLYEEGFSETVPKIYCKGKIIIFSINKLNKTDNLPDLFLDDKIKKIAIANPKLAPYGKAAEEFFNSISIYNKIKVKLIFAENVNQTILISLNGADIGIIPESARFTEKLKTYKKNTNWFEIDPETYNPINQAIILLKNSDEKAILFYDFIFSDEVKEILINYGYAL